VFVQIQKVTVTYLEVVNEKAAEMEDTNYIAPRSINDSMWGKERKVKTPTRENPDHLS